MKSRRFLPLDWSSLRSQHHLLTSLGLHYQRCSGTSFACPVSLTAESLLFCCVCYSRVILYLVPWFQNIVSTKQASDFLAGTQDPKPSGSNLIFWPCCSCPVNHRQSAPRCVPVHLPLMTVCQAFFPRPGV